MGYVREGTAWGKRKMDKIKEKDYRAWLKSIPRIGNRTAAALIQYFGSAQAVFNADEKALYECPRINEKIIHNIIQNRQIGIIQKQIAQMKQYRIEVLDIEDESYPLNLKHIYDPPYILYKKGQILKTDENAVAIVGTRKASPYGKWTAYRLAGDLAKRGVTVVSGLAYGIDTEAHKGALDHGGRTIAVLGCGLDQCYPKSNARLMQQIERQGAVLSEYPIGMGPVPGNFPARNRIISGLAKGVVVVEAAAKSGALITAEFALEQGREVFAVPGNINSELSEGTNRLIQEGAKLVSCVEDILEELNIDTGSFQEPLEIELSEQESKIYQIIIENQPIHIEYLLKKSEMRIEQIHSIITVLQLKGLIRQLPGKIILSK